MVEISSATSAGVTVNRVPIALGCYLSVNPGSIQAQLTGGMVRGLIAALDGQQTFLNGTAQKKNATIRSRGAPTLGEAGDD